MNFNKIYIKNCSIIFAIKTVSDILFFLQSKPTINAFWWRINEVYKDILTLLKNMAEGNFQEFKQFLGTYAFSSKEDKEFNKLGLSISEFIASQMLHILSWSQINENKETKLVHTDQGERILANLQPVIYLLTEATTGPCKLNQQIILSFSYIPIYGNFFQVIFQEFYLEELMIWGQISKKLSQI